MGGETNLVPGLPRLEATCPVCRGAKTFADHQTDEFTDCGYCNGQGRLLPHACACTRPRLTCAGLGLPVRYAAQDTQTSRSLRGPRGPMRDGLMAVRFRPPLSFPFLIAMIVCSCAFRPILFRSPGARKRGFRQSDAQEKHQNPLRKTIFRAFAGDCATAFPPCPG